MTKKIAELLEKAGYRRIFAVTLAYLIDQNGKPVTSRDIERGADLRQPEVNIALSQLIEKKWVKVTKQDSTSKGRPVNIYMLIPNEELYTHIVKELDKSIKNCTAIKEKLGAMILPKPGVGEQVLPGSTPV